MKRFFSTILIVLISFSSSYGLVYASTTDGTIVNGNNKSQFLDTGDVISWTTTNGVAVHITNSALTGEIWSENWGWIKLNPSGGFGGVTNNVSGNLGGNAWGENTGWINFAPSQGGVSIDSNGKFNGYAWSENAGWIHFACPGANTCVETDWRPSNNGGNGGTPFICADGIDNDSDGKVDYPSDPGCSGSSDSTEDDIVNQVDVCPFIPGVQTDNSLCPTPVDYCPLIPGDQPNPSFCPDVEYDYCPNDPGVQNSVDQCSTPPTDVCPFIAGVQTNVDQCPPPPQDYCPFLAGVQSTPAQCPDVEYDYCPNDPGVQNSTTQCSIPPLDACPLIPGVQTDIADCTNPDDGYVCDLDPNILQVALCIVRESIDDTITILQNTWDEIGAVDGNILTKIIAIVGLIAGALFTILPTLFGNPLSFSELILVPYRLWSLLLVAFGLKKRSRPWGTVYDSITKQPLDPALVTLFDMNEREIANSITDIDGRYGFLVPPGIYHIVANKTHYTFPSHKLIGKTRDELYLDLYFGSQVEVKNEGEVIAKNIPMDPIGFDWNEFAKQDKKLMKFHSKRDFWITRIADVFFSFGFVVSFIALVSAPTKYNIVIFALYLLMLVFKEMGVNKRKTGDVVDKEGNPYSFAIIRVYIAGTDTQISQKVTSKTGQYYCLVQNGSYYITVEKKNRDESYTLVHKSEVFEAKHGILNGKITIDENKPVLPIIQPINNTPVS